MQRRTGGVVCENLADGAPDGIKLRTRISLKLRYKIGGPWPNPAESDRAERVRSARGTSDIDLFRYCQGIVDLDAEVPDRAFDLGMPEQELDGPEIARAPIDQCSFCPSQ